MKKYESNVNANANANAYANANANAITKPIATATSYICDTT